VQPAEPSLRQAAVLTQHWTARDIEAVVLLMAEIKDKEEAEDLIVALLMLRGRSMDDIRKIILTTMEPA
jgi:hypothetical protein